MSFFKPYVLLLAATMLFVNSFASEPKDKKSTQAQPTKEQLIIDGMFIDALSAKELGNYKVALEILEQILAKQPDCASCFYETACIYDATRHYDEAGVYIKKALAKSPKNEWYQLKAADIFEKTRKYSESSDIYKKLAAQYPANINYLFEWGNSALHAGKYKDFLKACDLIEKQTGVQEEISMQKHEIFLAMGKFSKAVDEIQKLIKENPTETKYYAILAEMYVGKKDYDKALDCYKKIEQINPQDPYINVSLANYYMLQNKPAEAFENMKKAYANPALDINTKLQLLYTADQMRLSENNVEELVEILVKNYPEEPKVYSVYSGLLLHQKKLPEARTALQKTLQYDKSQYITWETLLYVNSELNMAPDSVAMFSNQIIELFPEQPIPYLYNGMANVSLKKYKEAAEALEKGAKWVTKPDLLQEFHAMRGDAYHFLGEYERSDNFYRKALNLNPANTHVLNNFAYYLSLRKENLDEAAQMAKKAVDTEAKNATFLDTYGWVLYQQGKYTEAKAQIEKAMQNGGENDGDVLEHYGDILYRLNQVDNAVTYWQKALHAGSESETLKEKIKTKKLIEK